MSKDKERLTEALEEYAIATNDFDVIVAESVAEGVLESTWLAEHDAKVRAEALKEARDAINTTRNVPSLITLADKFGGYHQGQRSGLEMAEDIIDRIEREAGLK